MNLECVFGSSHAVAQYISETVIRCETPPHLPGAVALNVHINGLSPYRTTAVFEFQPKVSIFSIFPESGSHKGGTLVTVRGDMFVDSSALFCKFGHEKVRAIFVTNQTAECMTPEHAPMVR